MTETNKKVVLKKIPCIYYSLYFQKDIAKVKALFNSDSKFNAITPAYALKLGLKICHTNVQAQKIDGFTLKMFGMVLASFKVENMLSRSRIFLESFLLANTSIEMVLRMLFLTFSNANIQFAKKEPI